MFKYEGELGVGEWTNFLLHFLLMSIQIIRDISYPTPGIVYIFISGHAIPQVQYIHLNCSSLLGGEGIVSARGEGF